MFVDASVIVVMLDREPGWEEIEKRLNALDGPFFISPLVRFEAVLALVRKKTRDGGKGHKPTPEIFASASHAVNAFAEALGAEQIPITAEIGTIAIDASMNYGKAVGHPADLNFGDCFAYACARILKTPLIYKGHDFALTDLA